MPKELTHWIVAEEAFKALPAVSSLKELLRDNHECYLAGAILPDTLLHLFQGEYAKAALSQAHAFHNCPGNCFAPLLDVEQQYKQKLPPPVLACLLGVVAHCQADISFHPFVFSQAGDDMGKHYALETGIDLHLQQNNFVPPCRLVAGLITPSNRECILRVSADLFDRQYALPPSAHEQALSLHIRFQARYDKISWRLMAALLSFFPHTSPGRKSRLFYPLFKGGRVDIPGDGNWKHPHTGEQNNSTCLDLLRMAVERTSLLFKRIEANDCSLSVLKEYPGENLLTGLLGKINV